MPGHVSRSEGVPAVFAFKCECLNVRHNIQYMCNVIDFVYRVKQELLLFGIFSRYKSRRQIDLTEII